MSGGNVERAGDARRRGWALDGESRVCLFCGERFDTDEAADTHAGNAHQAARAAFGLGEGEAALVAARYFAPDGSLPRLPTRETHKILVLARVAERFEPGRYYSDAEVRSALSAVNEDFALLRRYLVDFRFMERSADGTAYRRLSW